MKETPYCVSSSNGTVLARFSLAAHVPAFCAQQLEAHGELRVHCDINWLDHEFFWDEEGSMDFVVKAGHFGEPIFVRADVPQSQVRRSANRKAGDKQRARS